MPGSWGYDCMAFKLECDLGPWWNPNSSPDPNQYTGDILVCWMNSGTNCENCRLNCGFRGKTCADYCYCRWLAN